MLNLTVLTCLLLQDEAAVKEAIERFRQNMKQPNPAAQAAAIQELARTPAKETLTRIQPFLFEGDKQLRIAAARGLGNFTDYKRLATPALMTALAAGPNQKEYEVQAAIYEGLGKLTDPMSFDLVHRGFRNEQVKVATGAISCAGTMRQKESMEPLIDLLKDVEKWISKKQPGPYKDEKGRTGDNNEQEKRLVEVQKAILKAVQDITKERWTTTKEWMLWWDRHKANFEPPK